MLTMRHWLATFVVASSTLAGACKLTPSMSEDQFCQEFAKRECTQVAALCSFTPETCEPTRLATCRANAAASKTGNRQYNEGATTACLDQVKTAYAILPITAKALAQIDDKCGRVFSGSAPV